MIGPGSRVLPSSCQLFSTRRNDLPRYWDRSVSSFCGRKYTGGRSRSDDGRRVGTSDFVDRVVCSIAGNGAFRAIASVLVGIGVVFDDVIFHEGVLSPAMHLESNSASSRFVGASKCYISEHN